MSTSPRNGESLSYLAPETSLMSWPGMTLVSVSWQHQHSLTAVSMFVRTSICTLLENNVRKKTRFACHPPPGHGISPKSCLLGTHRVQFESPQETLARHTSVTFGDRPTDPGWIDFGGISMCPECGGLVARGRKRTFASKRHRSVRA